MYIKRIECLFKKLIFLALMLLLFSSCAYADDFVVRDAFTGETINDNNSQIIVDINSAVSYDKKQSMYIYTISSQNAFDIKANVFDGMIVNYPVKIDTGNNIFVDVYKDGKKLSNNNYDNITDFGTYNVFLNEEEIFHFTIIGESTGIISSYTIPDGFKIIKATYNGNKAVYSQNYISLSNEGRYVIDYKCINSGVKYSLTTTIDNTAPILKLGEVTNGVATGPVDISDIEKNIDITILLNDKEIQYRDILKDNGNYSLILTDSAGNISNYEFVIKPYYNISILAYILIFVFIIISIFIYVKLCRKRIKVR